jgi:DNA polymerase-1
MEKKRLIIIDSNSIIHRAFYALPKLTTKNGQIINAVYGFLLVFLKAIREFQPDFIAATFDFPGPTFRHKEFKEYKATRPKAPDELYNQIPKIKEILKSFNVQIFEKEGFEADDLIGTIAQKAESPEIEKIILSGDLDTLQLVDQNTKVYLLRKGVKETILYDEEKVKEKYGILPKQVVDFKALKGDPSDNIPGVPGIGEKTALKLIKEFGSLENLYSNLNILNQSLRKKLQDYKEQIFLSKNLAKINQNVEIDFDFKEWKNYDREKVKKILKELEFFSLIERLP